MKTVQGVAWQLPEKQSVTAFQRVCSHSKSVAPWGRLQLSNIQKNPGHTSLLFPDSTRLKVIMKFYKENRTQGLKVYKWQRCDEKFRIRSHFFSQGPLILQLLNFVLLQAH